MLGTSSSVIHAQDVECEDYRDNRPYDVAKLGISGTAHFSARKFKVEPKLLETSSYNGYFEKNIQSLVYNYRTTSNGWSQATEFIGGITKTSGNAATALTAMAWTTFGFLVDTLQSFNIGHREYAFYAPVAGPYRVRAKLTGGWDKPRNRVIISGPEGSNQVDDDNPMRDVTKDYWVHLEAGPHSVSVQLGSGESAVFHNAGTLEAIELDSPSPIQWETPVLVGYGQPLVTQLMPAPGDTATYTVNFTIPNKASFPNLLDGEVVVDTLLIPPEPIQPHFYATWRADHQYWLCVTQTTLAYTVEPELNPSAGTARFFLQRGGDVMRTVVVKGPLSRVTE